MVTGSLVRVRLATQSDIESVCKMMRDFHAESDFKRIVFDLASVASFFEQCLTKQEVFLGIAERGGVVAGVMLAYRAKYFFSQQLGAWEEFVYVRPEFRGGSAGRRLIGAYVAWARAAGVVRVNLGTSSGINTERVVKFYLMLGFRRVGATLALDI